VRARPVSPVRARRPVHGSSWFHALSYGDIQNIAPVDIMQHVMGVLS
jgi:uncharacterized membrane protein